MPGNVQFVGRVSDEELRRLYRTASIFIFPSTYEGFGIPPLEAQACGCPVVASDCAPMDEVLQDSVEYADPRDAETFATAIRLLLTNSSYANVLVEKGFQNLDRFSWVRSANQLLESIHEDLG